MSTVRDIVNRALQISRIVALGREPKASEADLGLEVVQGMFDGWVEGGMFGRLTDVYETANYTANEYERVTAPTAITVTKPDTIPSEDRAPYELACIVTVLNGAQTNYIYSQGEWLSLSGLSLSSDAPLAHYDRHGMACAVAARLCETFGGQMTPNNLMAGRKFVGRIMDKFGKTERPMATTYY
jgi:hypothetical protein